MSRDAPLLQRKLLVWLLVPLSLLFLAGGVAGYFIAEDLSNDVYDRELLEIANELSIHLEIRNGAPVLDLSPSAERILLLDQYDRISYRISTTEGRTVAGDGTLRYPDGPLGGLTHPRYYRTELHGKPVSTVIARVPLKDGPGQRQILVQVAETQVKRGALADKILLSIVLPQFLLILLAAVVVWVGVAQGLSPLRRLRQAVEDRSHLDLSPIIERDVPGEVKPLLQAINELMLRLDEVLGVQNRFIADAAHQLRTPVAGLKANIEVALRETDPAVIKQLLAQVYLSVERLSRLVSQLLSLARNEPTSIRAANLLLLDLNKLIFNATMEWVPEAYRKGIDLGFEGPEHPVMIEGDAVRLGELVNNLLDNAIRYTPGGGRVTARILEKPKPGLSISDDGPRIPPEERERIFERFHRLLGSDADGSGLGLAIVREIASIHRAEVRLTDDADGLGNRFTVTFPPIEPNGGQNQGIGG